MNDPRPAFLFYHRDFWSSEAVELMSYEEVGLYLYLLSRQWESGSIPSDANALRTLCRRNAGDLDSALQTVLKCFEKSAPGRLQNRRLEFERARLDAKTASARQSAKSRWEAFKSPGDPEKADSDANAMRSHSDRNAIAVRTQCDRNASEGKGREDKGIQSPPTPLSKGGEVRDVSAVSVPAPSAKPPKRRPDVGWAVALARPEYAELRADQRFADAWSSWIEHTRTTGSKAKEPTSHGAVRIFNAAKREGVDRFVRAVDESIGANWQGIHYGPSVPFARPNRADAAIEMALRQGGIDVGGAR